MLRFNAIGGDPNASDTLVVVDLGPGDLTLVRQAADERSGRVTVAPSTNIVVVGPLAAPVSVNQGPGEVIYSGIERVDVLPAFLPLPGVHVGGTGGAVDGTVVVFESDPFETNDLLATARDIDDLTRIARNPNIDIDPVLGLTPLPVPPSTTGAGPTPDSDWFVYTAPTTGTVEFKLVHNVIPALPAPGLRPGLPGGGGDLDLAVWTAPPGAPNLGPPGSPGFPAVNITPPATPGNSTNNDETVIVPVTAGTKYYVQVFGKTLADINTYDLVVNPPSPGPVVGAVQDNIVTNHNLFGLKGPNPPGPVAPPVGGPTPVIGGPAAGAGIAINFYDLPIVENTTFGGARPVGTAYPHLNPITAAAVGNYSIVGDANGPIDIVAAINTAPGTGPIGVGSVGTGATVVSFPGTPAAASPRTVTVPRLGGTAPFSAFPQFYQGMLINFTTGPNAGNAAVITNYEVGPVAATALLPALAAGSVRFTLGPVIVNGPAIGTVPANPAVADVFEVLGERVVLTTSAPLPDDRFTFRINDSIRDPAGNLLDGESDANEPNAIGVPNFPSGDQQPGGDFAARFTVDSRPEVATWSQGVVYADINGNFVWDPEGKDNDASNQDFAYKFGLPSDAYFTGNFSANAAATPGVVGPVGPGPAGASGFDKLGVYGAVAGTYTFALDTNDDGVADTFSTPAFQGNAIPVAGNFDGLAPAPVRSIPVTRSDFLMVRTGTWM